MTWLMSNGMVVHVTSVHKEQVRKVPNAIKGRDDFKYNIIGMDGVPQEMIDAKLVEMGIDVAKPAMQAAGNGMGQPAGQLGSSGGASLGHLHLLLKWTRLLMSLVTRSKGCPLNRTI